MALKLPFRPITNIIIDHPDPSKINPVLYDLIKSNGTDGIKGGARRTNWSFAIDNKDGIEELNLLLSWVEYWIPRVAFLFAQGTDVF